MKYDYDVIVIGMGPAGMAASVMASEVGLKVCAIEKNKARVGAGDSEAGPPARHHAAPALLPDHGLPLQARGGDLDDEADGVGAAEEPLPLHVQAIAV